MPLTSTTFFGFRLKIRPAVWNRKYVQYSVCVCTSVPVPHKSLFASALFALLLVGLLIGHQVLNIECLSPARLNGFLPATSITPAVLHIHIHVYVCVCVHVNFIAAAAATQQATIAYLFHFLWHSDMCGDINCLRFVGIKLFINVVGVSSAELIKISWIIWLEFWHIHGWKIFA